MRIIVNVEEALGADRRKTVRVRLGYDTCGKDDIRVQNCGNEIYNLMVEAFTGGGLVGGEVVIEGERR